MIAPPGRRSKLRRLTLRKLGLLFWIVALPTSAAWADPAPRLSRLEKQISATAADNPGEYGIAAVDLDTGAVIAFNGNVAFPMASTVKLAIAATYLSQVDAGRRSLSDVAGGQTAGRLMELMITRSDNHATDLLLGMLGSPKVVDDWVHSNGLAGIRVDRTIAELLAARRDLHDVRDSSTPTAMLGLLRLIDRGPALSASSRSLLLDLMRRCATGTNRIKGILPPGAQVEHKTGTLSGYTGDVGFLQTPTGRRIAIALFARGGENRPGVIASIARAIYDAFGDIALQGSSAVAPQAMGTR